MGLFRAVGAALSAVVSAIVTVFGKYANSVEIFLCFFDYPLLSVLIVVDTCESPCGVDALVSCISCNGCGSGRRRGRRTKV